VAGHLGTEHTELYVTPEQAMGVIPRLPTLYDEPFADSSQIPTFLVSQLARRKVTVSLSGDAGDELFGGYGTYLWGRSVHQRVNWMPRALRTAAAKSLGPLARFDWNGLFDRHHAVVPASFKKRDLTRVFEKLTSVLTATEREALYRVLLSYWVDSASVVLDSKEKKTALTDQDGWAKLHDFVHVMMYVDTVMYLPDDILVKVDRASMGVSLESRVPLLDHRVIEFAWRLPLAMKIEGNTGKSPLRQLLYKYVPRRLVDRPKRGFAVPVGEWLRGQMRPWAEELISESRLRNDGYFAAEPIRQKWHEHLKGRHNWQPQLWGVLMFQAWLDQHKSLSSSNAQAVAAVTPSVTEAALHGAGNRARSTTV
jgi:asparagine synthase (glutamine-hydrolysing)